MPEQMLEKLKNKILPQWKICFFASLFVGFLTHFYKLTNWLPNWDSLVFRCDAQNMLHLGRWFLPVVSAFSSFYDLPFLNGALSILFHALGAVCITKMLGVKKGVTAFLIGAFIVSFPTVTSVLMYNYVADAYGLAFFLSCLAAERLTAEKPSIWVAALFIALSAGIYQAYITVTIMLLLLHLAEEMIFGKAETRILLKKTGKFLLSGALGVALYGAVLVLSLFAFGSSLSSYQGIGDTAQMANVDILGSLYAARNIFFSYFFDFSHGFSVFSILNVVIFAFTASAYIFHGVQRKVFRSIAKCAIGIALVAAIFIGGKILVLLNPWVDYHNLMLMGYAVFYLYFILLYERGGEEVKTGKAKCWAVFALSLLLILNQFTIASVSYHKAQLAYEKSYGVLIRIADRIEMTASTGNAEKILVIGALSDSEAYSASLPPDITGVTDGYILRADDASVGQSVLTAALNDYCGKNYKFLAGDEKKAFLAKEEIKAMPLWPDAGSVALCDGVLIIKLGEEKIK